MAKKYFFSPSNAVIVGVQQDVDQQRFETLDDIAQITFTTPQDTKPVFSFGNKEQIGYSYGATVCAGTFTVPANSYPSFFKLFERLLQLRRKDMQLVSVSAEELPPFDILIVGIPEYIDVSKSDISTFVWTLYGVKIVETSIELSTISPEGQIMLYRFTQNAQKQKIVSLKVMNQQEGTIGVQPQQLYTPYERELPSNSFLNIQQQIVYWG